MPPIINLEEFSNIMDSQASLYLTSLFSYAQPTAPEGN